MNKPFHSPLVTLFILIGMTLLVGCQASMQESGVILNPDATTKIHPGITSRSEVLEWLGPPTLVNSFRPNRWLYIQDRKFKNIQRTFSRATNRIEITFDSSGIVETINKNFDDKLLNPTTLPEADNDKGWVSWLWDDTYIKPATENRGPTTTPPLMMPDQPQQPVGKRPWWRPWSTKDDQPTTQDQGPTTTTPFLEPDQPQQPTPQTSKQPWWRPWSTKDDQPTTSNKPESNP